MENKFLVALVIAICYLGIKFLEMRFVLKENKKMKLLIRDAIICYVSVLVGLFIIEQFEPLTKNFKSIPVVFTNEPDF